MRYLFNFITLFINIYFLKKYLHIYQLKDYNFVRYFKYFLNLRFFYPIFCLVLLLFQIIFNNYKLLIISNCLFFVVNFMFNSKIIYSKKTPLIFTNRIKHLYIIGIAILTALLFVPFSATVSCFCLIFLPPICNLVNFYDKLKNNKFIMSAVKTLQSVGCKIIAITGSNGKTSVKNILQQMLSSTYKVQCSPKSYNTPLGISKFINEELEPNTQFLILEYGARHKNDIKKLCKIFGADYGIITLVAPQHLESFKTKENVYIAKKELSNFLNNKFCVYNLDNLYTYRMFLEKQNCKAGVSIFTNQTISANNIKIKNYKTHFTLFINNKEHFVSTPLLGKHNVTNILLATALAYKLKVPIKTIVATIKKLQPTPHRIELIKAYLNVLDDSYNCSLESAKTALEVLNEFKGKKVVCTPGIIEGGKNQYNLNFTLGKMCTMCDLVLIVGNTNKKAILDGLKSQNFKNFICCESLETAKKHFNKLNKGDNLLLLNDLPDDYN